MPYRNDGTGKGVWLLNGNLTYGAEHLLRRGTGLLWWKIKGSTPLPHTHGSPATMQPPCVTVGSYNKGS